MLTIAWDVDDVLNELMREWLRQEWLPGHPACALTYEHLAENPPHRLLGASWEEYARSLDRFRNSSSARSLAPSPDVLSWLTSHGGNFRHLALTGRPLHTVPVLAEWVFFHYGKWIRTFSYVPSRDDVEMPVYDRSKRDYLQWLGRADVLVDDNRENIEAAISLGI
jgi:hypothetical protein